MSGLYVYAVVRADHPAPDGLEGVGGEEVRLLRDGRLAVAVTAAPDPLVGRRRELLAHSSTVEALWAQGPVLPMRFGVVAPDEDALRRDIIDDPEGRLADRLDALADAAEMSVKIWHDEPTVLREVVAENREIAALRARTQRSSGSYGDQIRLGELVAAAVEAKASRDAERLLADLTPLAAATVPGPPVDGALLNASFLIGREQADAFRTAVDRLISAEGGRFSVRVTGPVPPYSFVDEPQTPEPRRHSSRRVGSRS